MYACVCVCVALRHISKRKHITKVPSPYRNERFSIESFRNNWHMTTLWHSIDFQYDANANSANVQLKWAEIFTFSLYTNRSNVFHWQFWERRRFTVETVSVADTAKDLMACYCSLSLYSIETVCAFLLSFCPPYLHICPLILVFARSFARYFSGFRKIQRCHFVCNTQYYVTENLAKFWHILCSRSKNEYRIYAMECLLEVW